MEVNFTQEVKDKWLENLKSGKYVQGYATLHNKKNNTFCCIGVLGDCIEGLNNDANDSPECPYRFLKANHIEVDSIWKLNDKDEPTLRKRDYNDDYSNVIPLIESLEVVK